MTDNSKFVSIIIPCFNEEEYIGACIDSVRSQDYDGAYEIIAVDNGSSDSTVKIISQKGALLEHTGTKGPAATKNRGIEVAKGEILIFLDGDCRADDNWLKHMVSGFEDPGTGCVAGEIIADKNGGLSSLEKFLIKKGHLSQKQHVEHPFMPYAATANTAYRRDVLDKIGGFDESLIVGEDADLSWRMQLQTDYKLRYVPEAAVFHPYEAEVKDLFRQKRKHACGSVKTFKKYREHRKNEIKGFKEVYWEYHALLRKWKKYLFYKLNRKLRDKESPCPVDEYQLILESAWKIGLLQGSIRHGVWKL
jgi:cellulose synthase/poly-beta-1,6-N-acetylglucosamine synthase-like glycosyltransferase